MFLDDIILLGIELFMLRNLIWRYFYWLGSYMSDDRENANQQVLSSDYQC